MKVKKVLPGKTCRWIQFTALLFSLLPLVGCAGLPVRGTVHGQTLETRVDSEVARYYLTHYLTGKRVDALLDRRIDQVYQSANGHLPTRNELKRLSDEFSVDFAALYLADRIASVPVNERFRNEFDREYEQTRKGFPDAIRLPPEAPNYELLMVPTYLYTRSLGTGADLAAPRAALQKVG